jgi:sulfoxide reductase heme-binding subunit YedZ
MRPPTQQTIRRILKPAWFLACLAPLIWLLLNAFELAGPGLGADPIESIQDQMGIWGLRLLLMTLALTPLRLILGWNWLAQFRRMTGLFTLLYISIHFLNYLALDQGFAWSFIIEDIVERPFITLGALALLGLLALGITSTANWRRRLGRRWQQLHYLVYPIAILGCWHYWWQVKEDISTPVIYTLILAVLLSTRLPIVKKLIRKKPASGKPDAGKQ